jgi:putative acetyltransferase
LGVGHRGAQTLKSVIFRPEEPADFPAIRVVLLQAFRGKPYSNQTEPAILDALRQYGGLALGLVAKLEGQVVGHAAFSEVRIDGRLQGWFGLGPIGVLPAYQRAGIGTGLINDGFRRLRRAEAKGCVVVGDPDYYSRFGFSRQAGLTLEGFPPEYFQAFALSGSFPSGKVTFHFAFA